MAIDFIEHNFFIIVNTDERDELLWGILQGETYVLVAVMLAI